MLDHSHTKAILIGNSDYPNWPDGDICNIKVNLKDLKELLCNPKLIGIKDHPDTFLELLNTGKLSILEQVDDFMGKCGPGDNLLVYYAGHGLLDADNLKMLYLATADTKINKKKITCIPSDELKEILIRCKASNKIMILDCCYAGKVAGLQSDVESLRGNIWGNTEGVYFIMSSDRDEPSRFDPDDKTIPTFFTQKLIQTIEDGEACNNDFWTLDEFFEVMKRKWDITVAPKPLRLTYKEIGNLPFCFNGYKLAIPENIRLTENLEEKRWKEIEADPKEEDIQQFMESCGDDILFKKALGFLEKMEADWNLLAKVFSDEDPTAIKKFLEERNPCKPIKKVAFKRWLSKINNSENNTRALMDNPRQERGGYPNKDNQVWG